MDSPSNPKSPPSGHVLTPGQNGDWNEVVIMARDGHITHQINGRLVTETTDENPARPRSGVLALEITAGPGLVQFKDIRLQRLPLVTPPR